MQQIRRPQPATVSRRVSVVAGFYRTWVIDRVLAASLAEHVRRPRVSTESPTLGLTHLQFEPAQRTSPTSAKSTAIHCLGLTPNSREENCVLADSDITTLVAVNDLDEASDFYEMKLRLAKVRQEPGWIQYRTGTSDLIVYKSQEAGTNKATTAAWTVDDVASTVDDLKAAGVGTFQQYDNLPGTTRDGDIHHGGPVKMAWFKDPSGNIFEINGR
jgi:catechol 2,3-dioxygenase-like lactoylglutathione lyase family enzyme